MVDPNRDRTGAAASDDKSHMSLTMEEVVSLVIMVSSINPNEWTADDAKSLIYKCRSMVTTRGSLVGFDGTLTVTGRNDGRYRNAG